MKSIIKRILMLLLLCAFLFLINSCASSTGIDKLNGSFEKTDEEGLPYGWTSNVLSQSKKFVAFKVDDEVSYDGGNSVSISISNKHPDGNSIYKWVRRIEEFQPGSSYEIHGMIKTSGIKNSPFIEAECWNDKMMTAFVSTKKLQPVTGDTDWREVNVILKIPDSTVKLLMLIGIPSENNHGGIVWFDDVEFKKID